MNIESMLDTKKEFSGKIDACKKCAYIDNPFVPSYIVPDAEVVFVSEAPLKYDSDYLLKKTMVEASLDPTKVCFLSCVKCPAINHETPPGKIGRLCVENFLSQEFTRLHPRLVVLIGGYALDAFFPEKKITESKGNILYKDGQAFLPIFHPTHCLLNPHHTSILRRDLSKIRMFLSGNLHTDREFMMVSTIEECIAAVKMLTSVEKLGVDIETNETLNPLAPDSLIWTIAFAYAPKKAICFPLSHSEQENVVLRKQCEDSVREILAHPIPKCFHNATFDLKWLRKFGFPVNTTKIYDSMVLAHLLDELRNSKGLKALAAEYLDGCVEEFSKDLKSLAMYNCEDSSNTLRLTDIFLAEIKLKPKLHDLAETIMMPVIDSLVDLELNGFRLDTDYLKKATAEFEKKRSKILEAIEIKFPDAKDVDINSPKQLGKYFFDVKGIAPIRQTKTGNSVDADTLSKIRNEEGGALAKYVLKYREVEKVLSTYLSPMPEMMQSTGRIHAHFNLTGTVTGRLSSSKPNMQNLPRDPVVRRMFSVDPGYALVQLDASQAELRVGCSIAHEQTMIDAYRKGLDIHRLTASKVLDVPIDEVTKEDRQKAKSVNFGFLYGQKTPGFIVYAESSYGVKFSYREADRIREEFFKTYYRLPAWYQEVELHLKNYGQIEYPTGYTVHFPGAKGSFRQLDHVLNQAINYPIQGSASHIIFYTMIWLRKLLQKAKLDFKFISQVHDSIGIEMRLDDVETLKSYVDIICKDLIPKRFPWLKVPMVFDFAVGASWGDMVEFK